MEAQQSTWSKRRTRTIIVDDHPLYRVGLRTVLQAEPELDIVGEATTGADALSLVSQLSVDVALVDLHLPVIDGITLTTLLRTQYPECKVLAISAVEEPLQIVQMLRAGACGYFFKTQDVGEIIGAIRTIRGGIRYLPPGISSEQIAAADETTRIGRLSAREREVLAYLVDGQSNDDIASVLFVARRTIETHRQRIMKKLGTHTIADLVLVASRFGVVRR